MAVARKTWGLARAGWGPHLLLRGAGLVLLAAAWLGGRWLAARFGEGPGRGGADIPALAAAFWVFACASIGSMLASLGPGLLRRYPVSGRYRRHAVVP